MVLMFRAWNSQIASGGQKWHCEHRLSTYLTYFGELSGGHTHFIMTQGRR